MKVRPRPPDPCPTAQTPFTHTKHTHTRAHITHSRTRPHTDTHTHTTHTPHHTTHHPTHHTTPHTQHTTRTQCQPDLVMRRCVDRVAALVCFVFFEAATSQTLSSLELGEDGGLILSHNSKMSGSMSVNLGCKSAPRMPCECILKKKTSKPYARRSPTPPCRNRQRRLQTGREPQGALG